MINGQLVSRIIEARKFVEKIHRDQSYGTKPYLYHLEGVASMVGLNAKIVALLHDSVEDGKTTLEIIEKKFGPEISSDINALTRRDEESYTEYIERVANSSNIVIEVKTADLHFNLAHGAKNGKLKRRYENALDLLYLWGKIAIRRR